MHQINKKDAEYVEMKFHRDAVVSFNVTNINVCSHIKDKMYIIVYKLTSCIVRPLNYFKEF